MASGLQYRESRQCNPFLADPRHHEVEGVHGGLKVKKSTYIESRAKRRFELDLTVHFRLSLKGSTSRWGVGTIQNMSSSGISLRCRRPLPVGGHLELIVDWPAHQDGEYPIHLHATGFVVRSSGSKTALRISSHHFRSATEAEGSLAAIA